MPHASGLFIYPVKSLRGCAVPAAELDDLGFVGDRRFLVVDPAGNFLTQRTVPRMARVGTRLADGRLTLSAEGMGNVSVATASDPAAPVRSVTVWRSEGLQAEECGPTASGWLSELLGFPCHLVRLGEKFIRPILKTAARPGDLLSFADGAPILITSEDSLAVLNDRIRENHGEPVPMNRFRPNLVIAGAAAFAEDTWHRIRIGAVVLRNADKSGRCVVTTADQLSGERGKEPLKTLATFRRGSDDSTSVYFGSNYINESKRGSLQIGAGIELL